MSEEELLDKKLKETVLNPLVIAIIELVKDLGQIETETAIRLKNDYVYQAVERLKKLLDQAITAKAKAHERELVEAKVATMQNALENLIDCGECHACYNNYVKFRDRVAQLQTIKRDIDQEHCKHIFRGLASNPEMEGCVKCRIEKPKQDSSQ